MHRDSSNVAEQLKTLPNASLGRLKELSSEHFGRPPTGPERTPRLHACLQHAGGGAWWLEQSCIRGIRFATR